MTLQIKPTNPNSKHKQRDRSSEEQHEILTMRHETYRWCESRLLDPDLAEKKRSQISAWIAEFRRSGLDKFSGFFGVWKS